METNEQVERLIEVWWDVLEDAISVSNWEKRKRIAQEHIALSVRCDTLVEVLKFLWDAPELSPEDKLRLVGRFTDTYKGELDG